MFEKASRLKIRFDTPQGSLAVEDLWDLPLTSRSQRANLDDIARDLFKMIKESDDVSFVTPTPASNPSLQLKFDIAKHIIDVKVAERDEAAGKAERAAKKQQILAIIGAKEDQELSSKSLDDLRKMANEL